MRHYTIAANISIPDDSEITSREIKEAVSAILVMFQGGNNIQVQVYSDTTRYKDPETDMEFRRYLEYEVTRMHAEKLKAMSERCFTYKGLPLTP